MSSIAEISDLQVRVVQLMNDYSQFKATKSHEAASIKDGRISSSANISARWKQQESAILSRANGLIAQVNQLSAHLRSANATQDTLNQYVLFRIAEAHLRVC